MKLTTELWKSIDSLYNKILELPFNQELMEGTLDKEKFKFYIQQDSMYLVDYGKALSMIAAKAYDTEHVLQFLKFAEEAIVVEGELHRQFFKKFGVKSTETKSPTCFSYTNFLLTEAAVKSYEEAVVALLPCFWIYMEVGHHIYKNAKADNPYQLWIDTYAGEEFAEATRQAIDLTDQVAESTSSAMKIRMKQAFIYSTKLEYMFWDSAYRLEQWVD